jgi:uncharacterized protein with GYD domain
MSRFIVLVQLTGQGIEKIAETVRRADAVKRRAKRHGCKVVSVYWTTGSHDGVLIVEGPDDESVAALLLEVGRGGNVRTEALRAFDRAEMESILAKLG